MASPVFKTAWAGVSSPEGSTPFFLRQHLKIDEPGFVLPFAHLQPRRLPLPCA